MHNPRHILTINNISDRPYNTVENLVTFLTNFDTFSKRKTLVNHLSILAGDFNINLLKLLDIMIISGYVYIVELDSYINVDP